MSTLGSMVLLPGALYEQEVAVFKRYLAPLTSLENH